MESIVEKLIDFLENLKKKLETREEERRKKRISKLLWKLYRENGVFKCTDLVQLSSRDLLYGHSTRWIVDYTGDYLPKGDF